MTPVKISELSASINVTADDVFPVVDGAVTKKASAAIVKDFVLGRSGSNNTIHISSSDALNISANNKINILGTTDITGSLTVTQQITGSIQSASYAVTASYALNGLMISGSDTDGTTYNKPFTTLQFDDTTGLHVSESSLGTAFVSIASHFRDIIVSGSGMLRATGSDAVEVIASNGIEVSVSNTDTNGNGYVKELRFNATQLSQSLSAQITQLQQNSGESSVSASWASSSISSSYATVAQTLLGTIESASFALTASYALNGAFGGGTGSGIIDTGMFATTGSNIFSGSQVVNGIVTATNLLELSVNSSLIGPKISFQKANYASSQQDTIASGSLIIARGNNLGIYNAALEGGYTTGQPWPSPSGTLWNSIYTDPLNHGWSNLQSIPYRTYDTWTPAVNFYAGIYMIDLPMVLQDTINDKYYLIKFKQWTTGSQGGGFAYDRYEVMLPEKITFTRPSGSDSTVDVISDEVIIKRNSNEDGIYNTLRETVYDSNEYQSPLGTRWNSVHTDATNYGWGDLSNVRSRTYDAWREAVNQDPSASVGLELVMHDVRTDKYWMVKFTNWQWSGTGDEFEYERTEIKLDGAIKFADGAVQTVAFSPDLIPVKTQGNSLYSIKPRALLSASNVNSVIALGSAAGDYSDVVGSIMLGSSTAARSQFYYSEAIGFAAGYNDGGPLGTPVTASQTTIIGYQAATRANNILRSQFIGSTCGLESLNITNTVMMGYLAGNYTKQVSSGIIIGNETAAYLKTSSFSTFIGHTAGFNSNNVNNSNFIGRLAGQTAFSTDGSNAIGYSALQSASAQYVNGFGWRSGRGSTAYSSTFIGSNAGLAAGTYSYSLVSNKISGSIFIGESAGSCVSTASYSTFIGYKAGAQAYYQDLTDEAGFTFVDTGNVLGSNNIIIGTNITLPAGRRDSINIGGILFGTGSHVNLDTQPSQVASNGRIGINAVNPQYTLHVSGTFGVRPGSSVTPINNGDVVIEATDNTTLTFKLRGSDGIVRSGSITLS